MCTKSCNLAAKSQSAKSSNKVGNMLFKVVLKTHKLYALQSTDRHYPQTKERFHTIMHISLSPQPESSTSKMTVAHTWGTVQQRVVREIVSSGIGAQESEPAPPAAYRSSAEPEPTEVAPQRAHPMTGSHAISNSEPHAPTSSTRCTMHKSGAVWYDMK